MTSYVKLIIAGIQAGAPSWRVMFRGAGIAFALANGRSGEAIRKVLELAAPAEDGHLQQPTVN